MVRRSASSRFAADVFVFPGGTIRDGDTNARVLSRCGGLTAESAHATLAERGGTPAATPELAIGLYIATLRELFEEAGVLLALDDHGQALGITDGERRRRLADARAALQSGSLALGDLLEDEGLRLSGDRLIPFSHWITPRTSPKRFDTRFFVAAMPSDQTAVHCDVETTEGVWMTPRVALERCARGELKLVHVTIEHLRRLVDLASVDDVLEFARAKRIRTVCPVPDGAGGWRSDLEGDGW